MSAPTGSEKIRPRELNELVRNRSGRPQHIEAGGALQGASDETAAALVVAVILGLRDDGRRIEDGSPHGIAASPEFRPRALGAGAATGQGVSAAVVAPGDRACVDLQHPIRPSPECAWALEAFVASGIEMSPQGTPRRPSSAGVRTPQVRCS
jgi:hypothetical protein